MAGETQRLIAEMMASRGRDFGRADTDPESIANALLMAAPLGRIGQAVRAAPKAAAGLMGAGASLLGMGGAGEATDNVDPRQGEVMQLMKRVQENEAKLERILTTKTPGPRGGQDKLADELRESLKADRGRLTGIQAVLDKEDASRRQAEKPFREEYPAAYRALPLAGWAASALGGAVGAQAGKPLRSALGGAAAGVPTSVAAAVGPTAYDAAVLPTGSKHQKEAAAWLLSPEYWAGRVGPEVLVGSMLGSSAAGWGSKLKSQPAAGGGLLPQTPPMLPGPGLAGPAPRSRSAPKRPKANEEPAAPKEPSFPPVPDPATGPTDLLGMMFGPGARGPLRPPIR